MANSTNCPFCGNPTEEGTLYGDRYKLKWLNQDKELTLGVFAVGGIPIGQKKTFSRPQATGSRCATCKKLFIDE